MTLPSDISKSAMSAYLHLVRHLPLPCQKYGKKATQMRALRLPVVTTSKKESGFRPGDSTTNQLIDLVNDIHRAFDSTKSFEVRAIFLDISKAFDKVWHDGLIFKMRQNGVSGRLLKLFQNYLNNRK